MRMPTSPEEIGSAFAASPDSAQTTVVWLYGRAQYERGALARLVSEAFDANRHVDYPDNWRRAAGTTWFRARAASALRLRPSVHGTATARVNGAPLGALAVAAVLELLAGDELEIAVHAAGDEPSALGIAPSDELRWEASLDGDNWEPAERRPGTEVPPHAVGERIHVIGLVDNGTHYETAGPTLGRVVVRSPERPIVSTGESLAEALAPDADAESRHDVVRRGVDEWATEHELGFRYVVVRTEQPSSVSVEARARGVRSPGGFACSDPALTRIWSVGARTLHACMQTLMLDGIKRDRLPWLGDQSLNLVSNAFSIGDAAIARDSLIALGSPTHGYVNGISDYSLWWLITSRFQQQYFDDLDFVRTRADEIDAFAAELLEQTGDRGYLHPRGQTDGFPHAGHRSIFLDWGMDEPDQNTTALQLLWFWALQSTADMLRSVGHRSAGRWTRAAYILRESLLADGWDPSTRRWRERLTDDAGQASSYPNFLAALSGIAPDKASTEMAQAIRDGAVGTPFMRALALRALGLIGDGRSAIAEIRDRWGALFDEGAVSFPEEFARPGETPYEMYGRPYGKSLCHAWGSGPVALLPQLILGIQPDPDGWSGFTVAPELGDLDWAAARVPTVHGDISVIADRSTVRVWIPAGAAIALADGVLPGPAYIETPTGAPLALTIPAVAQSTSERTYT